MRASVSWVSVTLWAVLCPNVVHAHFLFIHIPPAAEGGRAAEVYFSERAEAGDEKFVSKIAHTRLWVQSAPDKFDRLAVRPGGDRLRAAISQGGSVAVIGVCEYGVLTRDVPFLLRYYPKAVAGQPREIERLKSFPQDGLPADSPPSGIPLAAKIHIEEKLFQVVRSRIPLEIMPTFADEGVTLQVLYDDKPVPHAVLTTVDVNLQNEELKADEAGRVRWKPEADGVYSVYVKHVTPTSGEKDGKRYTEIREFATLAFNWPLVRQGPDAEAVKLFQDALAARARWQDFPGFSAAIRGEVDGRTFTGKVNVAAEGKVELETATEAARSWVTDQLGSIVMHRSGGSRDGGAPPVLRFADQREDHPLGRLLEFEGGEFASSYRVRDQQILVVNRRLGDLNMTINVLTNDTNPEGKFLPRNYTVQYWDAASGDLRRTETVQDRWEPVGGLDLPAAHTVTTADGGGLGVRSFSLSGHKLHEKK